MGDPSLVFFRLEPLQGAKMKIPVMKWSDVDKQAFKDGNRLRAKTILSKKKRDNKYKCRIRVPINHDFD